MAENTNAAYVFDCSFTVALFIPDEKEKPFENPCADITEDDLLYVPQLWWYEVSNALKNGLRRKRFDYPAALNIVQELSGLNILTDTMYGSDYSEKLLALAHDYELSAYDAAYLELAMRKRAIMCTLDAELKQACEKAGVTHKSLFYVK